MSLLEEDPRRSWWRKQVAPLLRSTPTPFFLFSSKPIEQALTTLDRSFTELPLTHWLSVKTQPLPALIEWWRVRGRPVEVVSRLEYEMACSLGVPAPDLLVNGPAKHAWLPSVAREGTRVNFDSIAEIQALGMQAVRQKWMVGLRCNTASEFDPEAPAMPTQFGMGAEELAVALKLLRTLRLQPDILHFHLRTNVARQEIYRTAISEALSMSDRLGFSPRVLDIGGGLPAPWVRGMRGWRLDQHFGMDDLASTLRRTCRERPGIRELWMENGRWLAGGSGVLVTRILDAKERRGMRSLICDGGRTLNAMPSCWEQHDLASLPRRKGPSVTTTVNGPTCMAFDKLARGPLPRSLKPGDALLWLDAGAYHLSWETRFSHGAAAVFWQSDGQIRQVRRAESFEDWNRQWLAACRSLPRT